MVDPRSKDPGWMHRYQEVDSALQAQVARRNFCLYTIDAHRIQTGLWPYSLSDRPRRGRPPALHPLPRHASWGTGVFTAEAHKRDHRTEFYPGCRRCKQRERLYFEAHPERRPPGMRTEGTDEWGNADIKRWVTPNWVEKLAKKEKADKEIKDRREYLLQRKEIEELPQPTQAMRRAERLAQIAADKAHNQKLMQEYMDRAARNQPRS